MLHVALFEPEIPPNTGNIIRLCANTGFQLHLIKPLGFDLQDKAMRRAGLDYHEWANMQVHENFDEFITRAQPKRLLALTTKGSDCYSKLTYEADDAVIFGPESRGLPEAIRQQCDERLRLPMKATSRSLNLSNCAAIVVYEAWRQLGFAGAE
ncbi:MAG: tRNA (uridine(34)/cytosine(34)/5-carboxymethylaminomethyluridine(34)-2'-O)-methyltransferase TrmL [Gammaproteobacteria bacterium]|jgi:tRNA (cytidine/uridine-2'-O-)-methyltransferase|nr:tRNA (uridine(34)/cytosine(34)/5-carboxymethylaminomethyluridine(34)-2'-O)-methyltransferase TrmL [Gammaproteobacteria bacterium]MCP4879970.1 tRNA (uridine(34)/cytosine(34)/5-carboxymethylaminomethyluridine(34)-2'-O)-methyltransferase TrmL [Gammaproteobacteria bacterium]MDP6164597.1 tRNA (uridine(34)/cytosine(34)/5-carboxymethylaminomethyluridine(34)-2'-O)-methyltransferase TrmL [Gammaproteobacteria bacterium]